MDRQARNWAMVGFGLAMVALPGCKLTRPEVPPGRPLNADGYHRKAIEFSTDGHPVDGSATASLGASNSADSMARSSMAGLTGAGSGSFGPPGSSGLAIDGESTARQIPNRTLEAARTRSDASVLPAGAEPSIPSSLPDDIGQPAPMPTPAGAPATLPADLAPMPSPAPAPMPPIGSSAIPSQTVQPDGSPAGTMGRLDAFPSPN